MGLITGALEAENLFGEGVEIRVQVGFVEMLPELLHGVAARGHEMAGQAASLGGGEVVGGIADHEGFLGGAVQFFQGISGEARVGLAVGAIGIARADDDIEPAIEAEVGQHGAAVGGVFVGKDGEPRTLPFEGAEEPVSTRQNEDVIENDARKVFTKERFSVGGMLVTAEFAECYGDRAADRCAHRSVVAFRQPEHALGVGHAFVDRCKVVDQSPVEIEEDVLAHKIGFIQVKNPLRLRGNACGLSRPWQAKVCKAYLNMADSEQKAEMAVHSEGRTLVVRISGAWSTGSKRPTLEGLVAGIDGAPGLDTLHFDADALSAWDSSLLVMVRQIGDWADSKGLKAQLNGLPEGVRRLIELSQAVPENEGIGASVPDDFLTNMGARFLAGYEGLSGYFEFLGQLCIDLFAFIRGRGRIRFKDFLLVLQDSGAQALPIVTLLSFLTGLIIAFIGVIQLQKFAADIYVADLVGLATTRELGAVMAGVIMAGRTGAAFAAQIGSMQVNEEVDALRTFGISPVQFLVVPRVIALVLMMPLLCACADLIAMLGGMVVAILISDVTVLQYTNQIQAAVGLNDVLVGIFKSAVFGVIIALAGCYRGLNCGRDASSVGRAATSAVVTSITWIVVADAIFAVMFHLLGI